MKIFRLFKWVNLGLIALVFFLTSSIASADGFIWIPPDPIVPTINLSVKYHHVTVTIDNQVAQVHIEQVFHNPNDYDVEGTYVFPVPDGATLSAFSMYVDDEELIGEIYEKEEARQIYEAIVRQMIDPALLEYLGQGMFQATIYPIEANSDKKVEIDYTQVIEKTDDALNFVYPLDTESFSSENLENVTISVNITTNQPIKNIYSPTHNIGTSKTDEYHATASYEENDILPKNDFELIITESEDDVAIHVTTFKEEGEDGYFLLLGAPKVEYETSEILPKEVVFVLDNSGSMWGDKFNQAKEALKYVLNNLNSTDKFNIVVFSDGTVKFKEELVNVNADNLAEALDFVDEIGVAGGTNIDQALTDSLEFFSESANSQTILFLTDGEATVGETETTTILINADTNNAEKVRLFVFGVGYDVNTHLLDQLADGSKALSTYVTEDESIEANVSELYDKISHPVLKDLSLEFSDALGEYDLYPISLPDLFKDSQLVVFGRYRNPQASVVRLNGYFQGILRTYTTEATFTADDQTHDYLPILWANRKIGSLLDEIRLHGENQELIDQIIAISKEFGIITEYTSFLIQLDTPWDEPAPMPMVEEEMFMEALDEADFAAPTGTDAFDAGEAVRKLSQKQSLGETSGDDETAGAIENVGAKTFYLKEETWTDNDYVDQTLTQIQYGTDEYFDFIAEHENLSDALALGKNVIVCEESSCYYISEEAVEGFNDTLGHWAKDYILTLKTLGILSGYPDGTFKPNQPINRAEAVKIILFANDLEEYSAPEYYFPDVESNQWYRTYLDIAVINDIVEGYPDGTFRPGNQITRAEFLKMAVAATQTEFVTDLSNDFTDVSTSDWFHDYVSHAYIIGIVSGKDATHFAPHDSITRAEASKIIAIIKNL